MFGILKSARFCCILSLQMVSFFCQIFFSIMNNHKMSHTLHVILSIGLQFTVYLFLFRILFSFQHCMSSDFTLLFAFSVHFISNWTISHTNTVKHNIIRFNRIAYNILYVFDREFISNCSNFVYICVRVVVDLNKCRLWYRSRINATIHREIALYFSSVEQTDRFILM